MIPGIMAATKRGGGAADPYWDNVVLLVQTKNATPTHIPDSKIPGRNWVRGPNNTTLGAGPFDGPGVIIYRMASQDPVTGLELTGQFTMERWVRASTNNLVQDAGFLRASDDTTATVTITAGGNGYYYYCAPSSYWNANSPYMSMTPNDVWFHMAVTRDESNVVRMFENGILRWQFTASTMFGCGDGKTAMLHTISSSGGEFDQYRVTKGVARYVADFDPPNAPFPVG